MKVLVRLVVALVLAAPCTAIAQGRPLTLDNVVDLVTRGVRAQVILNTLRSSCIAFRPAEATTRLRAAGAPEELLTGLNDVCVVLPDRPAPPDTRRDPTVVSPSPQPTAPQCDPDQGTPQFVARAWLAMSRAISTINNNTGDPTTDLKDALRILTDPRARDRNVNPIGQNYTMAQAFILLLGHGTPDVVTAADIGIQTNPTATIDLIVAADSLLTAVETAHPECADLLSQWRQQKPWLDLMNSAINLANANLLDSAETVARRALILDRRAPYAHTVLAAVARERGLDSLALANYERALAAAGRDTMYNDVRVKTLGDIARLRADRAQAAPAERRRALAREAIAAYETLMAEAEVDDLIRAFGLTQLSSLYVTAGDSARIRDVYRAILANPSGFGERTLLEAGMVATRADAYADAARFFSTVSGMNPYNRDALNNLAASYIGTREYSRVFPLLTSLLEMDPNNPDVHLLYGYAYGGLLRTATDAATRRTYTDSLLKYTTLAEQAPLRVAVSDFVRLRAEVRLSGTIENRSRVPRSYTLTVEFLGRDGTVLATQEATVGPVAAGARGNFQVTAPIPGESVAGYRYRRLTP